MRIKKIDFSIDKQSNTTYILLLFLITIVGYWQIASLKYVAPHDMIDCWLPWRYYLSNCFDNHVFPYWNPYQSLGYPIHADLQGPTWYLESILLNLTIGQNIYSIQSLFLFYTFIAGVGFYFLSLFFQPNKLIAFIVAAAYMFSGFFVSHIMHLYAIISAAWIPLIIYNYLKTIEEKSFLRASYTSIFIFFNVTGGNHTFTIILFYILIAINLFYISASLNKTHTIKIFTLLKLNGVIVILSVLLSMVVFIVYFQTANNVSRFAGLSYEYSSQNPFSPQSLISWILPFACINSSYFFNTDGTMCNTYFGLFPLMIFILFLFRSKSPFEKFILVIATVCLLASFGSYTPLQKFFYKYVPLLNLFRFPSYYCYFTLIIILILVGNFLYKIDISFSKYKKNILQISMLFATIFIIVLVIFLIKNDRYELFFLQPFKNQFDFIESSDFIQNVILQSILQLLFLTLFILLFIFYKGNYWLRYFAIISIVNLMICTQLNMPFSGISPDSTSKLQSFVQTLPKGFPIPANEHIIEHSNSRYWRNGLYNNSALFYKEISYEGFNSYSLKNFCELSDEHPFLFRKILNNNLFYLSNNIHSENELLSIDTSTVSSDILFVKMADYKMLSGLINSNKSKFKNNITFLGFNPNKSQIMVHSNCKQILTFLQANYPGWEAFIDHKKTAIFTSNFMAMSIVIPQGKHVIEFIYANKTVKYAGIFSYSIFSILIIVICFYWWTKNHLKVLSITIISLLVLAILRYLSVFM